MLNSHIHEFEFSKIRYSNYNSQITSNICGPFFGPQTRLQITYVSVVKV